MSAPFDYEDSLRRMGGDAFLLQEMAGFLRVDAPVRLAELKSALAINDYATASRAAHSLKGFALNFGARRTIAAASILERCADLSSADQKSALVELESAVDELLAALAGQAERGNSSGSITASSAVPASPCGAIPRP